jgi:zinc/manganese transport system substrate-binding protein
MNFKKNILLIYLVSAPVWGKIKVVASTPDMAYLAHSIGGAQVEVFSLLDGSEDPHFVDAVPLFIQKTAAADVFIEVGLGLEEGWVPKVLQKSGNKKIQSGSSGFCSVGSSVDVLEKAQGKINRSMGDVHGEGNPHFHLSPRHYLQGADRVLKCLKVISPQNEVFFNANYLALKEEINRTSIEVKKILSKSTNKLFAEYHKHFLYFLESYQLQKSEPIEIIPGVPPSAGRLAERAQKARQESLSLVIAANYQNEKVLKKFKELSGVKFIKIAPGLSDQFSKNSYYEWQMNIAKKIADE